MQNKGVIRFFAILLAIVCVYQLSFTYITYRERKHAKEFAQNYAESQVQTYTLEDPSKEKTILDSISNAKEQVYIDSILNEEVYTLLIKPLSFTFNDCQKREINLGLDLKGGMNVILEISVEEIIKSLSTANDDSLFISIIELSNEKKKSSHEDYITLFGESFDETIPNARMATFFFGNPALKGRIDYNTPNEDVLKVIQEEAEDAIENTFNILRSRIDHFGVVQPNIQRLETQGRILVELPGVKEPERVRELLQSTAKLEFWETYENAEVYQYMLEANETIRKIEEAQRNLQAAIRDSINKLEESANELAGIEIIEEVGDSGDSQDGSSLLSQLDTETDTDAEGSVELLDQLTQIEDTAGIDTSQLGDIKMRFPLFAVLQPNVSDDGQRLLEGSVVGYARKKDMEKVISYLNMPQVRSLFPRNIKFLWTAKPILDKERRETDVYRLHAIKMTGRDMKAPLGGDAVTQARQDYDDRTGEPVVRMNMNADGSKEWARLTKENVGRFVAVVMDDYVYSSARVRGEITGGSTEISGGFTVSEAKVLANILKSGKLDATAEIIQEAVVGPSLGKEAIQKGFNSFALAFVVILCYMLFYYSRRAGYVADFALIANMFFLIGVLASLSAVLTLPGIAGIVLTVGMSVDANVLIYERIREELAAGKGIKMAINDGYKNAYSAIIDANLTTLITGIILYVFGTGPIRGFATTLVIGIVTSLFSAIFITRLIFIRKLEKNRSITFDTRVTRNAFKNLDIDFLGKRKLFYVISSIVIIIGIGSLFVRGLNLGVDFTGGRTYVVKFDQDVTTLEVQDLLKDAFGDAPEVKTFGSNDQVKIVTSYRINESSADVDNDVEQKLYNGLKPLLGEDVSIDEFLEDYRQSSEKVGPTIADDIKRQAVIAILVALLFVFIYILIRFRNWQFGFGATLALVHDTLLVLGLFSLLYTVMPFSLEIDQAFIAAILTVVGYSINDTVVIFDRIREYVGLYRKRERHEIINMALNSTLSRTFSTSFSTFIVLLAIFLFGGEVIRGFTFALLVGVIVGTYSSLFIASPVVYDTIIKSETTRVLKAKRRS